MLVMDNVEESSYVLEHSKVFELPSMSRLVLREQEFTRADENGNDSSVNFEDLMSMERPEGVDFHASYNEVLKSKVKITQTKIRKMNNSCPALRLVEDSTTTSSTTTKSKVRRRKIRTSKSAMERRGPVRSMSFTSSPPQHFGLEIPKPKLIPPRRSKSLHSSFPNGASVEQSFNDKSQPIFSAYGAFKPLHSSVSFSGGLFASAKTDYDPQAFIQRMHKSFPAMPSNSEYFVATGSLLAPQETSRQILKARKQSTKFANFSEKVQGPRSPKRSTSMIARPVARRVVPHVRDSPSTTKSKRALQSSFSETLIEEEAAANFIPLQTTQHMHHASIFRPSESGDFLSSPLVLEGQSEQTTTTRKESTKEFSTMNENEQRSRGPSRSTSSVLGPAARSRSPSKSERVQRSSLEKNITCIIDGTLRTPRPLRPTLTARSQSLSSLGLRIEVFKSPTQCDVSRSKAHQRQVSLRGSIQPESPRRQRGEAGPQQTPSSPGRSTTIRRRSSPRRGSRRSAFLVKSKSARMDHTSSIAADPTSVCTTTPNPPPCIKSAVAGQKNRSTSLERSRLCLHSIDQRQDNRIAMDDSFTISASDVVPLATFALSKHTTPNKSQLKKSFKDTLHLVGKWKRKAKKEDEYTQTQPESADKELICPKKIVSRTPETSISSGEHFSSRQPKRRESRKLGSKKMADEVGMTGPVDTKQIRQIQSEISRSDRKNGTKKRVEERVEEITEENSLVDALDVKDARLESYMTKTPQKERKKVDKYWVEAFQRNYVRRSDFGCEKSAET